MHPIKAFVLLTVLYNFGIGLTFTSYVPFLLDIGLTLADVAAVNLVFMLVSAAMEVPTGMVADGRSRIWSVRIGLGLHASGLVGYATATGLATALLWEAVLGASLAFISGAQQAWLADALKNRGESDRLSQAFGSAALARSLAFLLSGIVGIFIALGSFRYIWLAAAVFNLAALAVSIRFMNGDGEPAERFTETQALRASCKALTADPRLFWSVLVVLACGLATPFNYTWSPFFHERAGLVSLSWVWALLYSANALTAWLIRRRGIAHGREAGLLIWSHGITAVGMAAAGLFGGLALPLLCLMVHELGRGLYGPVLDVYTQRRVESSWRATFGSLQSLVSQAGVGCVLIIMWLLSLGRPATPATISELWLTFGALLLAAAAGLWLKRPTQTN
jgi:MFS family permease